MQIPYGVQEIIYLVNNPIPNISRSFTQDARKLVSNNKN